MREEGEKGGGTRKVEKILIQVRNTHNICKKPRIGKEDKKKSKITGRARRDEQNRCHTTTY